MRKKVLLLINGSAGPGDIGIDTYAIIEKFARAGWEPTVFPILPSSGMGAEDLIEEYAAQSELVVCAGGDGTLNHAITALMKLEHPPRLGYLPAGSTNDFAKGVNIPTNLDDACDAILNGRPFSYDIGADQIGRASCRERV